MFPPRDPTRRRFLSQAAGVAVGGTVLARVATQPLPAVAAPAWQLEPVFGLIEAHREASARHGAALREQERLERIGDPEASTVADEPCHADMRTWRTLVGAAPLTLAGLRAWASYLDEIRGVEEWMLEDYGPTLVVTLAEALGKSGGVVMKARSSNVVKFPYDASRRVHARKPRGSKNGTPEERAAKAAADARIGDNLTSVPSRNAKPTAAEIYRFTTEEQTMIRELQIREAQYLIANIDKGRLGEVLRILREVQ